MHNLLDHHFHIRLAHEYDLAECIGISRQYPNELAFVRRVALEAGIKSKNFHVAIHDGVLVGFVLFHRRKDGIQTIYDLAVHKDYAGLGIGRQLLYSVPCPVRLKVKRDNARANTFYTHAGMRLISSDEKLNTYYMKVLVTFVAGNNTFHPEVAYHAGMAYGTQQYDKPRNWPFMLDVEFDPDKQDWNDYMDKVCRYHPVMAMVTDYMHPTERPRLYKQIRDLKAAGVLRVMVCPKFEGAIDHIPTWCVVAISAPAKSEKFKGWLPDNWSGYKTRRVHILGGTPVTQAYLYDSLKKAEARVISVDGNGFQKNATLSVIWSDGRWYRQQNGNWEHGSYEETLIKSARNIQSYLNQDNYLENIAPTVQKRRERLWDSL